ncbi:MAG: hypothetical protein IT289_12260 [Oligoflexia bacterium]|nr:hypothetical protein [Oligoflexia bacterium]
MRKLFGIVTLGFLLSSCGHHRDVRPGADGVHKVTVRGEEKEEAERSAISQAEHYCKEFEKRPAFIEEKTVYTGNMDEKTRDTVRKASKAAMVVGGTASTFGKDEGTRTAGGVVGVGGGVGSIMAGGNDYTSEMKFKCN